MCSDAPAVCEKLLLLMHGMEGAAMQGMKLEDDALSTVGDMCVHPDD